MWKIRTCAQAALLGLSLLGLAGGAAAQDKGQAAAKQNPCGDDSDTGGDQAPKVEVVRGPGGEQIIRIKQAFCIEGKIQKPNVFYVLERSSINYEWEKLNKDFMPRVLRSVERAPF